MNKDELINNLDSAISDFNEILNNKALYYSKLGYNGDAILMFDELGKQTSELAHRFRDCIYKYLD